MCNCARDATQAAAARRAHGGHWARGKLAASRRTATAQRTPADRADRARHGNRLRAGGPHFRSDVRARPRERPACADPRGPPGRRGLPRRRARMKPMLEVRGLAAGYGPAQVLFDVNLAIDAGEVVTLLGRNGMGKTTTINTIMGIVPARAGEATFQGRPLLGRPSSCRAGRHWACARGPADLSRAFSRRKSGCHRDLPLRPQPLDARARLRALPRADRTAQTHGRLSGGEQQILAIGRALLTNPKLLILDEATEGLAP